MGYFSRTDLTQRKEYTDRTYPSFEHQLIWRWEDLRERYQSLLRAGAPYHSESYFSHHDYRYAPAEAFTAVSDVLRAMETARKDLEEKCHLAVRDDGTIEEMQDADEQDPDQVSILEIVYLPSWFHTAQAA